MKQKELSELSDQELIQEQKKTKSSNIASAILIGVFIGIAVYSTVTKSLGFFTFFPLFFAYILFNNGKKNREVENELKSRNLK